MSEDKKSDEAKKMTEEKSEKLEGSEPEDDMMIDFQSDCQSHKDDFNCPMIDSLQIQQVSTDLNQQSGSDNIIQDSQNRLLRKRKIDRSRSMENVKSGDNDLTQEQTEENLITTTDTQISENIPECRFSLKKITKLSYGTSETMKDHTDTGFKAASSGFSFLQAGTPTSEIKCTVGCSEPTLKIIEPSEHQISDTDPVCQSANKNITKVSYETSETIMPQDQMDTGFNAGSSLQSEASTSEIKCTVRCSEVSLKIMEQPENQISGTDKACNSANNIVTKLSYGTSETLKSPDQMDTGFNAGSSSSQAGAESSAIKCNASGRRPTLKITHSLSENKISTSSGFSSLEAGMPTSEIECTARCREATLKLIDQTENQIADALLSHYVWCGVRRDQKGHSDDSNYPATQSTSNDPSVLSGTESQQSAQLCKNENDDLNKVTDVNVGEANAHRAPETIHSDNSDTVSVDSLSSDACVMGSSSSYSTYEISPDGVEELEVKMRNVSIKRRGSPTENEVVSKKCKFDNSQVQEEAPEPTCVEILDMLLQGDDGEPFEANENYEFYMEEPEVVTVENGDINQSPENIPEDNVE